MSLSYETPSTAEKKFEANMAEHEDWGEHHDHLLVPYLSEGAITQLK